MPLSIFTHIVSADAKHCRRCGVEIPLAQKRKYWVSGERVGIIIAPVTGSVTSYMIGENDSNELCAASPLVARIEAI